MPNKSLKPIARKTRSGLALALGFGMKMSKNRLVLYLLANVAASFPIFIVGGSFIFVGNNWGYFGVATMIYTVLSCVLVLFTLANPTREVLLVDRAAVVLLLASSLWAFAVRQMYEHGFIFALGSIVVLTIKWLSHAYAYQYQTLTEPA